MLPPSPHDSYGAALGHWKSVQTQLANTIQDYLQACLALKSALTAHPSDVRSSHLQNKAFADLDYHFPALYVYEEHLQDARISLQMALKNCQCLAPINSLPPEILHAILSLAGGEPVNQVYATVKQGTPVPATTLASVCSLWRRLALQSPGLWSRIKLVLSGPLSEPHYRCAELCVARSQGEKLRVSVWEGDLGRHFRAGTLRVCKAIQFLYRLMPRVSALEIVSESAWSTGSVFGLLRYWARDGSIGTAEVLKVHLRGREVAITRPIEHPGLGNEIVSPDRFDSFFRSLHTLSLGNAIIDRSLTIYSGLIDLHLGYVGPNLEPSDSELAAILAASPGLRSLAIVGLGIKVLQGHMVHPVALNDLQVLSLESNDPTNLWVVLRMITSTSEAIRMSMSLGNHAEFIPEACSFFKRCKVTILHVDSHRHMSRPDLSWMLVPMPHLEQLAITDCPLPDAMWEHNTRELSIRNGWPGIWPRLRELYLMGCNPDQNFLQQLVTICVPRALWLYDDRLSSVHIGGDAEGRKQAAESLLKSGVELIWIDSRKEMPTRHWGFVHSHEVTR